MSLRVRVHVEPSDIHDMGIFAGERIPRGGIVWRFDPEVDTVIREKPMGVLADWSWREEDCWVVPGDDARFMNHSFAPSVHSHGSRHVDDVAARDIEVGEELTVDYSLFDLDWPTYAHLYKRDA